jgi:hypothetical protein
VANCIFENATTAGDFVSIGSTTAGDCRDAGGTRPASGQIIGMVLASGAAGTYAVRLFDSETIGHPEPSTATVATSQTTASTSYTDLATSGPAVTVNISSSGKALVTVTSRMTNGTLGNECYMGVAVSGATTVAASDAKALFASADATYRYRTSATHLLTGLNAGSNTFTAKYKAEAGTCTIQDRDIIVTPY